MANELFRDEVLQYIRGKKIEEIQVSSGPSALYLVFPVVLIAILVCYILNVEIRVNYNYSVFNDKDGSTFLLVDRRRLFDRSPRLLYQYDQLREPGTAIGMDCPENIQNEYDFAIFCFPVHQHPELESMVSKKKYGLSLVTPMFVRITGRSDGDLYFVYGGLDGN